jgi:hypothetical protein
MVKFSKSITTLTCLALLTGCFFETSSSDKAAYEAKNPEHTHSPDVQMLLNDFGGLTSDTLKTNAMPLKLVVAAVTARRNELKKAPVSQKTILDFYKEYGFLTSKKIANWDPTVPQAVQDLEYPIGVARGMMAFEILGNKVQFEIGNVTCAACHSGKVYDSRGLPTDSVWMGAPNTSLNIEGYSSEIYSSLKFARDNSEKFYSALDRLFPSMGKRERKSMEKFIFSETMKTVKKTEKEGDHLLPAYSGPPGSANAIASFSKVYGILKEGEFDKENHGFVNIPDLSYRGFRRTAVVDGIYTLKGEEPNSPVYASDVNLESTQNAAMVAATFTVPVMGVDPKRSINTRESIQKYIGAFLYKYRAQKFPGVIDEEKALRGEQVYRNNCMKCHGEFSPGVDNPQLVMYPNRLIPQEKIGTDSYRLDNITDKLADKLIDSWVGEALQVTRTKGYMPPPLANIWSTAPYFHNGSVPTLWALLNPNERPVQFYVGGHALDFKKVGITYPEGYKAWSRPVLVDTRTPGLSNKGHEGPVQGLTQDQKVDLIEYLKVL